MIEAHEIFDGTWPFAPNFFHGNGFAMHYVDENPEGTETFLCVHGEPTWGYLYRNIIPRLARHGRVVVPDQMGFGKSETPQDRRYTIEEHCENLDKLVLELDLTNLTLVLQDWGGPIGSAVAYRHPERVKRLCVMMRWSVAAPRKARLRSAHHRGPCGLPGLLLNRPSTT